MKKLIFTLCACAPLCSLAGVQYTIVPLVGADPMVGNAVAVGINRFGDSVGSFYDPGQAGHGFAYRDGTGFADLGVLPGGIGYVTGINDAGQIAAFSTIDPGRTHALRYTPGVGFVDLGTGPGRQAETTGINNSGQVTGFYEMNDGSEHAFLYTAGRGMQDLGVLSGQNSGGRGINDLGWVTGTSGNRAFIYQDGVGMVDIGPGSGWAINNAGVVAGEGVGERAAIFLNGQIQLLGFAGSARGLNNNNTAVGFMDHGTSLSAFVWSEQEGVQDLNSLVDPQSGWYLAAALGINDAGQIVGWGYNSERGTVQTPFRLDPIPEPSTWALMILAGGMFCVFRRRAKAQT